MRSFLFLALVLLVVSSSTLASAEMAPDSNDADPITVELLTMGPGDHPFFKFGHNAFRIRDARRGSDVVYNYGTFSFSSPTLLRDFFKGRLEYWLSRDSMTNTLEHYGDEDRSLVSQRLALSPEQKRALKKFLEKNARPENRAYKYDYFFDNCSTRLRDAIDRVTDGQLRESFKVRATQSLRDHALRASSDHFLEYLVLSIGLGPLVDKPTDRWGEAFLPEMLTEGLRHVTIRDSDGSEQSLVASEEILLEHPDTRLAKPPQWKLKFLLTGVLVGLVLAGLAYWSRRRRASAIVFGSIIAVGGLVIGLLGLGLLSLWTMTDHAVAYRNQNLLLLSPLALGLPWYGLRAVVRGSQAIKELQWLGALLLGSGAIALTLKLLPLEWQDNGTLIAFFLPCWAGLWSASLAAGAKPSIKWR